MTAHIFRSALAGAVILGHCGPVAAQDADEEPDPVILGIALTDAPMTPPKGLAVSEAHAKPVSAKFENAAGDVRLSIDTATGDGFVETAFNPKTSDYCAQKTSSPPRSL